MLRPSETFDYPCTSLSLMPAGCERMGSKVSVDTFSKSFLWNLFSSSWNVNTCYVWKTLFQVKVVDESRWLRWFTVRKTAKSPNLVRQVKSKVTVTTWIWEEVCSYTDGHAGRLFACVNKNGLSICLSNVPTPANRGTLWQTACHICTREFLGSRKVNWLCT